MTERPPSPAQVRRELRAQARERQREVIPALRAAIKATRAERKRRLQRCAGQCLARKARVKKAALAAREQLRARILKLRAQLKQACGSCRVSVKDQELEKLDDQLGKLAAEREAIRQLRRKAGALRSSKGSAGGKRSAELRAESDDEVRRNVADDPLLAATWQRLKHKIKGSAHLSRTEAFLEHVHNHPEALEETQREQERRYDDEAAELLGELKRPAKSEGDLRSLLAKLNKAASLTARMQGAPHKAPASRSEAGDPYAIGRAAYEAHG